MRILSVVLSVVVGASACGGAQKPENEVASTAPSAAVYPVPSPIASIVTDRIAFATFAKAVRPDLEKDIKNSDPTIAKSRLFVLAMLDALEDRWGDAVVALDKAALFETTPEGKAMLGLTLRVWNDARGISGGAADHDAFRVALDTRLTGLKLNELMEQLLVLRAMGQTFTPEVCAELVATEVGPHVIDGKVGIDDAHAIVFQRFAVVNLVPVGKVIDEVLAAKGIGPPVAAQ
jgi:hypothetical protein